MTDDRALMMQVQKLVRLSVKIKIAITRVLPSVNTNRVTLYPIIFLLGFSFYLLKNTIMTTYSFEMVDDVDVAIEGQEDGLVLNINDDTLQSDVSDYLVPVVNSKRAPETPLTINIHLDSVSTRKAKYLLEILHSVLIYFEAENILVVWNYEATDEKAYETGLRIQNSTKINFSFQVY